MDTPPTQHPRWCSEEHCQPDLHAGRPHVINCLDPYQPPVTAQLVQAAVPLAEPRVVIATVDGAASLPPRQARALGHTLTRLALVAEAS